MPHQNPSQRHTQREAAYSPPRRAQEVDRRCGAQTSSPPASPIRVLAPPARAVRRTPSPPGRLNRIWFVPARLASVSSPQAAACPQELHTAPVPGHAANSADRIDARRAPVCERCQRHRGGRASATAARPPCVSTANMHSKAPSAAHARSSGVSRHDVCSRTQWRGGCGGVAAHRAVPKC